MCDETTEVENEAYLKELRLNRREMAIGAGAIVASALTGCPSPSEPKASRPAASNVGTPATATSRPSPKAETQSRRVSIDTADGIAEAFFVSPKTGSYPAVVMWPDVAGLRDAYRTMAKRLAGAGYAVLAVNPYYRSSKLPVLKAFAEWRTEEGRARIRPMRNALTPEAVTRDGAAFTAWLDQQPEVDRNKKTGTCGYCMGGSFTFRTAVAAPERVGAIASFHGGGLVSDKPTSPHKLFSRMKATALICIAQNDDARQPDAKTQLGAAAKAADIQAEIEVYPAQHGWCTIDSPVYAEAEAERAWARMLALFERNL